MKVLFLCCTVKSVRFSIFNYTCPVWCLQYDCAVPHDGVGPRGDALRGGNCAALLPFSLQVSRALGTDCKIIMVSGHLNVFRSALETDIQMLGFFDLWQARPTESVSVLGIPVWVSGGPEEVCQAIQALGHAAALWYSFCYEPLFSHSWF